MWNGKKKAITFSFDDGVTQDKRLIEMFDRYGLKATFNLNSSLLGLPGELIRNDHRVRHDKVHAAEVPEIYRGHEVAGHTLTHPNLAQLEDDETIVYQVEEDRKALERITGKPVRGFAYPGGGINNTERVCGLVRTRTGAGFARTTTSTHSFDLQTDLAHFCPTVYYIEDDLFPLAEKFLALKPEEPALFYIWGHSYEMDAEYITWERFEEFCRLVSGKEDIFYGTNSECLLDR